jgi:CubicO group peptidase (beta-lactamase class C family)
MRTLSDVLADAVGGFRAPGAVVVLKAPGEDGEELSIRSDPSQLFEIGSITKTMTALLVLQHVERGQIELDDPISTHLPDLRLADPEATDRVTIRHLLSHTSGIDSGDDFTDTGQEDDCLARYTDEVLPEIGLLHEPGKRWSYNNGGYTILGRLIEVLDGRPFDDALIERVFKPLGLTASTTARLGPDQSVAEGHRFDPHLGSLVPEPGRMPRSAGPAGNVVATAADLAAYCEALFSESSALLGPQLVQEMLRPQIPVRGGNQGIAWLLPSPRMALHGGATRGSSAFLAVIPGSGSLSVVADGPGAGAIAGQVRSHLFGTPAEPEPASGPGAHVDPEACVGTYRRRNVQIDVSSQGHAIVASSSFSGAAAHLLHAPEPVVLEPIGGGRFLSRRFYEDGFGVWDFDDLTREGIPTRLLTRRLLNRRR